MTDKEIDDIYDLFDFLMKKGKWELLDGMLSEILQRVWRTEIDMLLTYLTATLPAKSKLPSRTKLVNECKRWFPDNELWKGLE